MKRLSPAKRNQLIMVLLITAAIMSAEYFLLISPQNKENHHLIQKTNEQLTDLAKYKKLIEESEYTSNQMATAAAQLAASEKDIATGDVYSWIYDTIRRFKASYHLDIPTIGQPTITDEELIPNFPYKQVRLSLSGTGYYHDIGKFVSDFENNFPHMRLVNLAVGLSESSSQSELLSFHVDVVALVKPNT